MILDEGVGSLSKPNNNGYLPHENEHQQPLGDLPDSIHHYFGETLRELKEADYMIITPTCKKELVLGQLGDVKLYNKEDEDQNYVHDH